ncbi:MAG: starch-binding protein [Prevotella sp.]|nr:starch-binding protein [Prevotella sp.]
MRRLYSALIFCFVAIAAMAQGWPENYKGVMLQGFYWDSYDDTRWLSLEKQANDLATSFSLIWIPQSGNCGGQSMGYDDLYWFTNYNSSFGDEAQLRSMINTFKEKGLGTIADVVINHRRNVSSWTDFPAETYNGVTYQLTYNDICSDDEAAKNGYQVGPNKDTGEGWDGMRDLDHKSENVQKNVKAYLKFLLNDLGYTGFRYDMVKGYAGEYTKMYNEDSKPQFSVGECWDSSNTIQKWIDAAGKTSAAFDFQFKYVVRNATDKQDWSYLNKQNDGNWPLISESFQNGNYRQYAVTFVENHDTEVRSDGSSNGPLKKDTLAANAFLLAMPGTPCVFLKHWQAYKSEIKAMIEARKLAGISNTSSYTRFFVGNPTATNTAYYANTIDDKLLVVVGNESKLTPDADKWTKILSGYHYAYYLAKSMETAWANQGSGDFTDAFNVTLTAVSANSGAKLVYTTDGSEPSASNGTKVDSGTSIKIENTTTLKVGLLIGSTVSGIISRTFTYKEKEKEPEVSIPDFCKVNEGEVCAFFEAPTTWTNTIHCWAWTDSPSDNFTGGSWPGVACELLDTAPNGNKVWKWTWNGKKQNNTSATEPAKIIFNNNEQPQTGNLDFKQGGYYTKDKLFGIVPTTGIRAIDADTQGVVKVYTLDGRLVRTAAKNSDALSGLAKGIYIVNKKKFIIK